MLAMPTEVFRNCDDDGEEEEEQNVVDEVFVQQSGVKDADSPRHVTIQTKTTLFQSILTKDEFIHIIGIRLAHYRYQASYPL